MSCLSKSDYYAVASVLTIYTTALTVFITSCETCSDFILNVGLPLTIGTRQKLKKLFAFTVTIMHDI